MINFSGVGEGGKSKVVSCSPSESAPARITTFSAALHQVTILKYFIELKTQKSKFEI
jgi:hypothetical protein